MFKQITLLTFLIILPASFVMAAVNDNNGENEPKLVGGMSIVGNNETPKSLIIVPWKSTEITQETKLNSVLYNDNIEPIDKATFMHELELYKLSHPN